MFSFSGRNLKYTDQTVMDTTKRTKINDLGGEASLKKEKEKIRAVSSFFFGGGAIVTKSLLTFFN